MFRDMDNFEHPVFIGGTGRCGTTVMADFIGSDDNFFLPCHENKLIVEADGLIDLCTAFTSHNDDPIRKHRALVRFFLWSERLRDLGCQNMEINKQLHEVTKLIGWQNAVDLIQRELSNFQFYPEDIVFLAALIQQLPDWLKLAQQDKSKQQQYYQIISDLQPALQSVLELQK